MNPPYTHIIIRCSCGEEITDYMVWGQGSNETVYSHRPYGCKHCKKALMEFMEPEQNFLSATIAVPLTEAQLQTIIDGSFKFLENRLGSRPLVNGLIKEGQAILDGGGIQALYAFLKTEGAIA